VAVSTGHSGPSPSPTHIEHCLLFSHDDILANVGLTGKPFTAKHKDRVTEMSRAFLDYMKSLRLQAPEAINPNPVRNDHLGAEPIAEPDRGPSFDTSLTHQGYPILPTSIMETELSKAMCERLMRAYLTQHYCTFIIVRGSDPNLITLRSGEWEEEFTGAIQRLEERYASICRGVLSPGRVYNQRTQKHAS
jgi:hypothetical protein